MRIVRLPACYVAAPGEALAVLAPDGEFNNLPRVKPGSEFRHLDHFDTDGESHDVFMRKRRRTKNVEYRKAPLQLPDGNAR